MEIITSNRATLKTYFVKNSIPKERDFADLIDGMMNQKDDGIVKRPGGPLSLEAASDATKTLINFYPNFQEATPAWTLSLTSGAQVGLNISDGAGTSRLFIDRATGNVGIGTTDPKRALHVKGNVLIIEAAAAARLYMIDTTAGASQSDKTVDKAPAWALDQGGDRFRIIREPTINSSGSEMLIIQKSGEVTVPGEVTVRGKVSATSFQGSMDAGQLTGVLALERLPELPITKITGLQGALDGKLSTTAPVQAGQLAGVLALERLPDLPITKITGLQGALDGKLPASGNTSMAIGTQDSGVTLDIAGKGNTSDKVSLQLKSGNTADNYESNQITFGYNGNSDYRHAIKTRHHAGQQAGNAIDFYVWQYGTNAAIGTLHTMSLNGGNVGIGTKDPKAVLHVQGPTAPGSYENTLPIAISGKLRNANGDEVMKALLAKLPPYTVVIGVEDHSNGNLLFYWMGGADGKQFKRRAITSET